MVSNKFAKKHRIILERVLDSDNPSEQDMIQLCGGKEKFHRFMMNEDKRS